MESNHQITQEEVQQLTGPTDKFKCNLKANEVYKLQFLKFRIRDIENDNILFEMERPADKDSDLVFDDSLFEEEQLAEFRTIRYNFSPEFLELNRVGTFLEFKVADDQPVKDFTIIERHYFDNQLIQNYEFSFPFCIPGSVNTWEKIYDFPPLDPVLKQKMIENPWKTQSDTFYFVGDKLVMHNKAFYSYKPN